MADNGWLLAAFQLPYTKSPPPKKSAGFLFPIQAIHFSDMDKNTADLRPTSPHLSIYRPQITSVLSILHRITGVALYAGSAVRVVWLWSAAYNATCYSWLHSLLSSLFGRILMIGWSFAFFYHLCNGMRHLWWDSGRGYDLKAVSRSGWLVVTLAFGLTAFVWLVV